MNYIYYFDLFGVFVFAISGILTAIERKFDIVGAAIIGFVTALGGGTLRDMMLGETPVAWMKDLNYFYVVLVAIPLCYLCKKYILKLRKGMFLFDTLGIGLFTILGVEKTLALGLSPIIAILMGVVSAVFGGVIRDVLSGEIPLIFRKEIYATACVIGGVVYLIGNQFNFISLVNIIISIVVVIVIRYLSIKKGWSLNFKPLN